MIRFNKKIQVSTKVCGTIRGIRACRQGYLPACMPASIDRIHSVLYMLLLCKYISDSTYVLRVKDNLMHVEHPIQTSEEAQKQADSFSQVL